MSVFTYPEYEAKVNDIKVLKKAAARNTPGISAYSSIQHRMFVNLRGYFI